MTALHVDKLCNHGTMRLRIMITTKGMPSPLEDQFCILHRLVEAPPFECCVKLPYTVHKQYITGI